MHARSERIGALIQGSNSVQRWPQLAARLRACERIVAESADRAERRAAAAEISQILQQAETAAA
jgi:hypothetical protein